MIMLDALRIFVRVAELGSFTRAAEQLGMTKTRVSAALRALERDVGARLLQRTTRTVRLSPDGAQVLDRARRLILDADELSTLFQNTPSALTGSVRLDLPVRLARKLIIPRLPEFIALHPLVHIELSSTDRFVDLVQEGIDIAVRVGVLQDSTLIAKPLGSIPVVNCASKSYLRTHGTPKSINELAHHHLVHYVAKLGAKPDAFEYEHQGVCQAIPMPASLTVNNSEAYLAACMAGLGIIQTPLIGVDNFLAQGVLVEILPAYKSAPIPVSLVTTSTLHMAKRVRALMHWLAEILQPKLS
jgi:DNA-binding transcriptional LysR family regulator